MNRDGMQMHSRDLVFYWCQSFEILFMLKSSKLINKPEKLIRYVYFLAIAALIAMRKTTTSKCIFASKTYLLINTKLCLAGIYAKKYDKPLFITCGIGFMP